MEKIVVGSRESILAVAQSRLVMEYLEKTHPEMSVRLVTMKTLGDKILDRTLDKIGGKGLFVKELDKALREKEADITVHSLKDMPQEIPEDLPLVAFSVREDPRDVLVLPEGRTELDKSLPIGSSSSRRVLQLARLFPDMEVKPVRGNVQTRLRKLDEGQYSALVLAGAGLRRLGLEHRIFRYFEPEEMIPACGQGIIAVQGRKELREELEKLLSGFESREAHLAALMERSFVHALGGDCSSPIAAFARPVSSSAEETVFRFDGLYQDERTGAVKSGWLQTTFASGAGSEELFARAEAAGSSLAEKIMREGPAD